MSLVISTTTESPEDVAAALEYYGVKANIQTESSGFLGEAGSEPAVTPGTKKENSKPKEEAAPAEVDAEKPPAEGKTEPALETGSQADEADKPEQSEHKKLLKRIDKLTARAKTAEAKAESLDSLQREIQELRAQVSGKKTPAAEATPTPEVVEATKPQRPARPKLAQFEYDNDRYEAALDKYESEDLPKYEDALSEWTSDQTLKKVRQQDAEEAARQEAEQAAVDWTEAVAEIEGLQEKIESAADVMVSGAMNAVLRANYTPKERAALTNYLIDNPDESERITHLSTVNVPKPTNADWLYTTNVATRELARIEGKAFATIAKPGGKPEAVAPKPKVNAAPPAKPKPPVSAAPTPIEPVNSRVPNVPEGDPSQMSPAEYAQWRRTQARIKSGR